MLSPCLCKPSDRWQGYCERCTALAKRAGVVLDPVPSVLRPMEAEAPEGLLQERLRALCVPTLGLLYYHVYLSKKSYAGYPDVTILTPADLLRPGEESTLYLWELKSEAGVVSGTQRRWLEALARVTRVETGVFTPKDWPIMVEKLLRK